MAVREDGGDDGYQQVCSSRPSGSLMVVQEVSTVANEVRVLSPRWGSWKFPSDTKP